MLAAQKNAENGIFPDTPSAADSEAGSASGKVEVCFFIVVSSGANILPLATNSPVCLLRRSCVVFRFKSWLSCW